MPKPALAPRPLAPFADELYLLEEMLGPWQQKHAKELRRVETLRKMFRESCITLAADKDRTVIGNVGVVEIGPRGFQDVVNFATLRTLISQKDLDAVASVTAKALKDAEVAPEIIVQVTETLQTGWRPLKVFAKT